MGLEARVIVALGDFRLDVSLEATAGQTVAVLGPNGAGKTTLLRALAGLVPLAGGSVMLDGEVLEDPAAGHFVPPEKRSIGVVFQDYLLFPHLTAVENVAFGLRSRGTAKAEARRRAGEWLERVGLTPHAGSRPRQLSGGQAQRVALARALVGEPKLLLLDEPLAALDATSRRSTRRDLRAHLDGYGGVRVLVTHDPLEAAALADHLVIVEDGLVVQAGTPAEISARPRSRYVADLVGVNLLRGRARRGQVSVGEFTLITAEPADGDVLAVVHPRALVLHRRRPQGTPRNVWKGRAAGIDDEGERVRVQVTGPIDVVAEVTPAAVEELRLVDGGPVWVSVKATEVSVFPA